MCVWTGSESIQTYNTLTVFNRIIYSEAVHMEITFIKTSDAPVPHPHSGNSIWEAPQGKQQWDLKALLL